ncbi:MAG: site-2 protease family protein [Bradymonadaceae bacterium]
MFSNSSHRWHLFTLNGHKVYLEPWFLLLVAFFVFTGLRSADVLFQQLLWVPILFLGVLWHEFGHAIAIKAYGYGGSTIILQGFGGVAINERRGNSPPGQSIMISLAGPGASLLLAIGSFGALYLYQGSLGWGSGNLLAYFLGLNGLVNLFWAVFNMLPINPMDGGHVVLHGLRKFYSRPKAMLYSAYSSLATLALLVLAALAIGYTSLLLFALVFIFAAQNVQIVQMVNRHR